MPGAKNSSIVSFYDRMMDPVERADLAQRRSRLLAGAGAAVLEIGAGTGANLGRYPAACRVLATEPDFEMLAALKGKTPGQVAVPFMTCSSAEAIPLPSESVDCVVSTLVLCSVSNPERAVREIWRVLRPGGQLLFIEHVRGKGTHGLWQDLFRPAWSALSSGCHTNRETVAELRRGGFAISREQDFNPFRSMPKLLQWALLLVRPFVEGRAVKPVEPGPLPSETGNRV